MPPTWEKMMMRGDAWMNGERASPIILTSNNNNTSRCTFRRVNWLKRVQIESRTVNSSNFFSKGWLGKHDDNNDDQKGQQSVEIKPKKGTSREEDHHHHHYYCCVLLGNFRWSLFYNSWLFWSFLLMRMSNGARFPDNQNEFGWV